MPYLIIGLLVFMAGCAMTPRYANVSGAEGDRPEQYGPPGANTRKFTVSHN
jgi:hypothetical protein